MSEISVGAPAPEFELPATGGQSVSLSGLKGSNVVIYFYPERQHARLHYRRAGLSRQH